MLAAIAHAAETVLLVTGVIALIRSAFQYGQRTQNWHQINVVLFHVQQLSYAELRWWYMAVASLSLGVFVKTLNSVI